MAGKDGQFSLNQRQEIRYNRYEKQLANILEAHLARIKLIEKEWETFKEQNSKAFKSYHKTSEARAKDQHYQFNVNETANWTLINDKTEQKGNRIVEESDRYKQEYKRITEERDQFYAECVKEWKREQQGKGLYDTSSSENSEVSEEEGIVDQVIPNKNQKLEEEIRHLTEQIIILGELHNTYHRERNILDRDSFDFAILKREENKVAKFRRVYEHKLRERERILAKERLTFDIQSEIEESDGGYSEIEGFVENQDFVTNKIRKRKKRQPKPKAEDFNQENIERRERERRENYIRQQEQLAEELAQQPDLFESESEEEEADNMANHLRWSVQSVSKFHGESGQSATQHLYEFDDFLKAARIEAPEEGGDDANVAHIINDFVTTLKGKARIWFDMNVPEGERTTLAQWNAIRNKFKAYFHPLGSTKEQRIRAWKDMRWDPIKEAIDDFAYRYKELGLSLGLQQDSIFDNFKACIPGQYFVFVYNANDMAQAVDNLKKCIAAGPMVPNTTMNTTSGLTSTTTTQKDDKLKFMAMTEETHQEMFNQLQDTIDERLGPMEEGMYETKEMIDQVYQMISQGQQNQGQMRFNSNQGQIPNKFGQNQNRFNKGGHGQTQNFGQKKPGQNNFNRNGGNNREVFCTFCKRYRHQVGNCIALKAELRKRGYRIANNTNGFGNGFGNGSNGGQRNGGQPNRGGSNNRGGRNGFQNRSGGRTGFQERMNCMNEEDCDEDYDNDMNDEELFMCCVSEFQENTGLEVVPFEESN